MTFRRLVGRPAAVIGAAVAAIVLAGVTAAPAWAGTVTINFETPAITGSSPDGPLLTTQYQSQGVEFISPGASPVPHPIGFGSYFGASPSYLYRDAANAHSGDQVLRTWTESGEGCFNAYAQFFGMFTTEVNEVGMYVGTQAALVPGSAPAPIELAGYGPSGNVIVDQTVTTGSSTKDNTLLQITSSSANIAYFSVAVLDGQGCSTPALEVDDLSFVIPPTPPPPAISLVAGPPPSGPTGSPGTSTTWPVTVDRFNGAVDPVDLAFAGLPAGVTAAGGTTIPADSASSQTTDVSYSIAHGATPVSAKSFTISATTADASAAAPIQQYFTIAEPLTVQVVNPEDDVAGNNLTIPSGPAGQLRWPWP